MAQTPADLYLDLMARLLTRALFEDNDRIAGIQSSWEPGSRTERFLDYLAPHFARRKYTISRVRPYSAEARELGRDWPARAETMVGLRRLANARMCVESVLANNIAGDIIETGVWRGGTSIFMKAVLAAQGDTQRIVWLADSFKGLPRPDSVSYPADADWDLSVFTYLAADVQTVRRNFERYGLLDERVRFVEGWFKDTLPVLPIKELAVLRLDGDLYESTIQALEPLYPKLSAGGFCIVDDYGGIDACRAAVTDYRAAHRISDHIVDIDGWGVYWQKGSGPTSQ